MLYFLLISFYKSLQIYIYFPNIIHLYVFFMTWINDFISIMYPSNCAACSNILHHNEKVLCSFCLFKLPKTNFHLDNKNPLHNLFFEPLHFKSIAAYYFYKKGDKVQQLIHALKYKSAPEIGIEIGKQYGYEIKNSTTIDYDIIVPVPLHPKKMKIRGYNQSEVFAKGLSESIGIVVDNDCLQRTKFTETQTKKSKYERWQNVSSKFVVGEPEKYEGKHIVIVDDVITTGATIEACAMPMLEIKNVKLSVLSIACAQK